MNGTWRQKNTGEEKRDVIKSYAPENYKIGDVYVSNNNIYLELVTENNGRLILSGQDTIMNREIEPANSVKLKKSVTTLKQTQIAINMKEIKKDSAIKVIYPRHILLENARTVSMKVNTEGYYYPYVEKLYTSSTVTTLGLEDSHSTSLPKALFGNTFANN